MDGGKRKITDTTTKTSNNKRQQTADEVLEVKNTQMGFGISGVLVNSAAEFKNKTGVIFRLDLANSSTYNLISQVQNHVLSALKYVEKPIPLDADLFSPSEIYAVKNQLVECLTQLTLMINDADKQKKAELYPNLLKSLYVKKYDEPKSAVTERTKTILPLDEPSLLKLLNQYSTNTITQLFIHNDDPPFQNMDTLKGSSFFCSLSCGRLSLRRLIEEYQPLVDNKLLKAIIIQIVHQLVFINDVTGYLNTDISLSDIMLDFTGTPFILSITIPDTMPPQKLTYSFNNVPKVTVIDWGLKEMSIKNGTNSSIVPLSTESFNPIFNRFKNTSFNFQNIRTSIGSSAFFQLALFNTTTPPTSPSALQLKLMKELKYDPGKASMEFHIQGFHITEINTDTFTAKTSTKNETAENYLYYSYIELPDVPTIPDLSVSGEQDQMEIVNEPQADDTNPFDQVESFSFNSNVIKQPLTQFNLHPEQTKRSWPSGFDALVQKHIYKKAYKHVRNKRKTELSQEDLICIFLQYSSSAEAITQGILNSKGCTIRGDTMFDSIKANVETNYRSLRDFLKPYIFKFSVEHYYHITQLFRNQNHNDPAALRDVFNIVYDDIDGKIVTTYSEQFNTLGLFTREQIPSGTIITAFYPDKLLYPTNIIPEKHKPEPIVFCGAGNLANSHETQFNAEIMNPINMNQNNVSLSIIRAKTKIQKKQLYLVSTKLIEANEEIIFKIKDF